MAVLFTEGFDMYNGTGTLTGMQSKWALVQTGVTQSLVAGRFGGQALKMNDGSGNGNWTAFFSSSATFTTGFAWKTNDVAGFGTGLVYQLADSAGTVQLSIYALGVNNGFKVTRGANTADLINSPANMLFNDTWCYFELYGNINDTTGALEARINGTSVGTFSGDTKASALTEVSQVIINCPAVSGTNDNYFDDIYITNDGTRVGEMRIETLRPASAISKVWIPDSGTNNYDRVNETLVNGDTSYVSSTNIGDRDLYAIGSLSSTPATIAGINVVSYAEKTDALSRAIYNSIQSAGTDSDGSSLALGANYQRLERILTTDPNGSAAWTASRVNGLYIGPKLAF